MGGAPMGATGAVRKLSCQEVVDQLADYLDEAAHAELVRAVDLHLGACRHCRVEVDTIRLTIRVFRGEGTEVELPVSLAAKLQDALQQAYQRGCDAEDET